LYARYDTIYSELRNRGIFKSDTFFFAMKRFVESSIPIDSGVWNWYDPSIDDFYINMKVVSNGGS
jgi:hypothetical protein